MPDTPCVEVVRVRPKPGAEERLLELRPAILKEINDHYPRGATAQLLKLEDGTWLDLYSWTAREDAEDALTDPSRFTAFSEWLTLTELVSFEWSQRID